MAIKELPTFSVVVPCYNVEHVIDKCIDALLDQDYSKDKFSIIIIDDKSTDKTLQIIEKYRSHKQIKIIKHFKNRGLSAARNSGIVASDSDRVGFLDSDLVVEKNWASLLAEQLSITDVVGCMGDTVLADEYTANEVDKYLYNNKRGARRLKSGKPIEVPGFIMGNSAVKRDVLDECGKFDEKFNTWGGEDTDLAIRIWSKHPKGLRFEPKAVGKHYHQRKMEDVLSNMYNYGQTNFLLLLEKHPEHSRRLAADWIYSIKGKLVLNPMIYFFVFNIFKLFQYPKLVRYLIAYNVMKGARNPVKGYPVFQS